LSDIPLKQDIVPIEKDEIDDYFTPPWWLEKSIS